MLGYKLHTGRDVLQDFLSNNTVDFKTMDIPAFRDWLTTELRRKERDAIFQKRCEIREVFRQHRPLLKSLGQTHKRKEKAYLASPHRGRLEDIEKELIGAQRAVEGLTRAIESSEGEKRQASIEKRDSFVQKLQNLKAERARLLAETPEKVERDEVEKALARYKKEIGITRLEHELNELNQQQASNTRKAGVRFEDVSAAYAESMIFAQLRERGDLQDTSALRVLSGVTLGVAHTELDNVVVRLRGPGQPVEVLAVVEAKSNINDMASGFLMRQQNLGFLCGEEQLYDPEQYVTKVYRDGRFSKPAIHEENDEQYTFTQESFRRFVVDPQEGYFLDRLYFVLKRRALNGLNSGEYSRVMYRISTDVHFTLEDDDYLADLLRWIREFMMLLQTRDVLQIYEKKQSWAQQCFLLEQVR